MPNFNNIESWFKLVVKALAFVLLSYLIFFSFNASGQRLEWISLPFVVLLLLIVLGTEILEIKVLGLSVKTREAQKQAFRDEELAKKEIITKPVTAAKEEREIKEAEIKPSTEAEIEQYLKYRELRRLLKDYQFFWRKWEETDEKCDEVRFSDEFSGRPLRYIDHLYQDVSGYLAKYGHLLGEKLRTRIQDMQAYAKQVMSYQRDTQYLSKPVFSTSEYVRLTKAIIEEFNKETG